MPVVADTESVVILALPAIVNSPTAVVALNPDTAIVLKVTVVAVPNALVAA